MTAISWPQEFYPIECTDSHGFVDPALIRAAQRGAEVEVHDGFVLGFTTLAQVQGRVPDGTWRLTINDRIPGITPLTRAHAGSGKRS